jgi:hypothetical protein
MGVKKSARAKTARAAGKSAAKAAPASAVEATPVDPNPGDAKAAFGWTRLVGAGVAFVVIAILAGVMMFGGRDSAERAEAAAVAAQPDSPAVQPQPVKPVRVIAGVPRKKAVSKARTTEATGSPVAPKTASELPDAVMIEGCLEQTGQTFRLKNTSGEDAPKSRSWKSGFLKKGSRPVDVVDWNNRLKDHVGERISVSGMFVDGEMRVRSLRRVSSSCN